MTAVLALCWIATIARWTLTRRQAATPWRLLLSTTLTLVAIALTFTWLDARYPTTTPPRVLTLLFHLCITAAALTFQLYVAMAFSWLTSARAASLAGLWALQCASLWVTWPRWTVDPGVRIDSQFLPDALTHHLIFWGYFAASMAVGGVLAAYAAVRGRRDDALASVSLTVLALGCGLIVVGLAVRVLAARNGELDPSAAHVIALARTLDDAGVVLLATGTVSLHLLPLVRRRHMERTELRDLRPLWQHVRTAVPTVALPLSDQRNQTLQLHRARIEILDGLHALSIPAATAPDPRAIAAALQRPDAGGRDDEYVPAAQLVPREDQARELAALRDIARAFSRGRS